MNLNGKNAEIGEEMFIDFKYRSLLAALIVSAITGCSTTTAIRPASTSKSGFEGAFYSGESVDLDTATPGAEVYRLFEQGATGFVSLESLRDSVENLATKFCARKEKVLRTVKETTSKPPHILGNFPRLEWQFECIDSPKLAGNTATSPPTDKLTQLERLKKLMENGTLTMPEFASEKAKVLAAP